MKSHTFTLALALLAGCGLSLGQGHVSQPFFAAVGGALALLFLRRWPWWLGLTAFTLISVLASEVAYQGTVPLPLGARLGVFAASGLPLAAIFLAQSRAMDRRPGLLTALILPCGLATLEFLQGALSPTGTWGSLAYGFAKPEWLPLAQLASITGWIGLTFLVGWVAAMADLVVAQKERRPALVLIAVLGVLWAGGSLRLGTVPNPEREIDVVMQHGPTLIEEENGDLLQAHYLGWQLEDDQRARIPAAITRYQNRMLDWLRNEAAEQVDLVVWAEVLGWVSYAAEPAWTERVQELARATGTTFALGLGVYDPQRLRPYENKLLVVDGSGAVIIDYLKAKATPGAWHVMGDGEIPVVTMPWVPSRRGHLLRFRLPAADPTDRSRGRPGGSGSEFR